MSTDATTYPDCVDTFTVKAPGMLKLETPASSTYSVAATALTTLARARAGRRPARLRRRRHLGMQLVGRASVRARRLNGSTLDKTDYLALAVSETSGDAANVFVTASTCANVIATLTALLTPACGRGGGGAVCGGTPSADA